MTSAEQLALFDKHADDAILRLQFQLMEPHLKGVLRRLARDRLKAGFETFGDSTWHETPDELMRDLLEELADAVVYTVMRENARSGGPGSHYGERS